MSGRWFAPPEMLAELEAQRPDRLPLRPRPEPERLDRRRRRASATRRGNVVGLMPHPEHAVDPLTGSDDGLALFASLAQEGGREPARSERGLRGVAGAVRRRRRALGHDAAAADARRPPAARDRAGDAVRARPASSRPAAVPRRGRAGRARSSQRAPGATSASTPREFARPRPQRPDLAGRPARLLRALRRVPGQAEVGREDPWVREAGWSRSRAVLAEARFVHLIRDGRDVALSRRARGMGAGQADAARRRALWQAPDRGRATARRERLDGRYIELRYEDLVADPEPAAAAGLRADRPRLRPGDAAPRRGRGRAPRRARRPRRRGRPPGARRGRAQRGAHARAREPATTGANRRLADRDEPPTTGVEFEAVAGDLLRDLGYDLLS